MWRSISILACLANMVCVWKLWRNWWKCPPTDLDLINRLAKIFVLQLLGLDHLFLNSGLLLLVLELYLPISAVVFQRQRCVSLQATSTSGRALLVFVKNATLRLMGLALVSVGWWSLRVIRSIRFAIRIQGTSAVHWLDSSPTWAFVSQFLIKGQKTTI